MLNIKNVLIFIILLFVPILIKSNVYEDCRYETFGITPKKVNDFDLFKNKMAFYESSNDFKKIKGNYIGLYQFGKLALKDLKVKISVKHFRRNPDSVLNKEKQDSLFYELIKINSKYLKKYIKKYEGKKINNVIITKSGLLAAAHLVGAKNVKRFLKTNGKFVKKDGNNVPLTVYINRFKNYNI